jgi:hypothetical protein
MTVKMASKITNYGRAGNSDWMNCEKNAAANTIAFGLLAATTKPCLKDPPLGLSSASYGFASSDLVPDPITHNF